MLTAPNSPTSAQEAIQRQHHRQNTDTKQDLAAAAYNGFNMAPSENNRARHYSIDPTIHLHNMNIARTSKTFHILIIGGSFAGIRAAQELEHLLLPHIATITVVERRDQYFYNLGALRTMAKPELIDLVWLPYDNIFRYPHNKVIKGEVSSVYSNSIILNDGRKLDFDALLVATGSIYPPPCKVETTSSVKGKAELRMFSEMVRSSDSILVIGGGPTGVGLAAEIATEYPSKVVIIVHSGPRLMSTETNSKSMSRKAHKRLKALGVKVYLNERVIIPENEPLKHRVEGRWLKTSKGRMIFSHFQFLCNGITFNTSFMDTLDPVFTHKMIDSKTKQIRVLPTLQINHPELPWVFAAGDVCNTAGEKQAYRADSQGAHVARCMARMAEAWYHGSSKWFDVPLKQWHDPAQFMAVAMGPNSGVTETPWIVLGDIPTRIMKSKELFLARRYKEFNLEFPGMPKYLNNGSGRDMSLASRSPGTANCPDAHVANEGGSRCYEMGQRQRQKQQRQQQRIWTRGGVVTDLTHEIYDATHAMANASIDAADSLDNRFDGERVSISRPNFNQAQHNAVAFPYAEYYYSRHQNSPSESDVSDTGEGSSSEEERVLHDIIDSSSICPKSMKLRTKHTKSISSRSSQSSKSSHNSHKSSRVNAGGTHEMAFGSSVSVNTTHTRLSAASSGCSKANSHTSTLMQGPVLPRSTKERTVYSTRSFFKSHDAIIREEGSEHSIKNDLTLPTPPLQNKRGIEPSFYPQAMGSGRSSSTATIHLEQYN